MQQICGPQQRNSTGKPPKNSTNDNDDDDDDDGGGPARANLDSGYAWIILAIMFLLQSSIGGSARLYGLVYAKEVEVDYYDREQASWPIATASAVENLAGIMSPALVQWLSWRQIELISTSLFVVANVLAYVSDSLLLDVFALGLIQGLALSSCTVLSLVINNDYFERYRTTAYGISMSGSTFGLLYLSPLVTWLLDTYENFRLVYLALAGVFACNLVLVLFIKPRAEAPELSACGGGGGTKVGVGPAACSPPACSAKAGAMLSRLGGATPASQRSSVASISYMARSRRNSALSRVVHAAELAAKPAGRQQQQQHERGSCQRTDHQTLARSQTSNELAGKRPNGANRLSQGGPPPPPARQTLADVSRQSSLAGLHFVAAPAGDLEATDSTAELDVASLCRRLALELDAESFGQAEYGGPRKTDQPDTKQQKEKHGEEQQKQQQTALSAANLTALLRLPYLHCTWIMLALYYLVARIFVIILVDFARDRGLAMDEASALLNYWSFGELIGRLLLGSLIDLQYLSCKSCIALTCALLAGLMACMVLIDSWLCYAACSLLVAALISLEYMLINVMMVEYVGKQMVTNCYSLAACISSLVLFGRPSMIGFFRDRLGSYDGLLLTLAGLAGAFAVLFYLVEPLLVRRWPPASQRAVGQANQQAA
jgi:hypothetical protein